MSGTLPRCETCIRPARSPRARFCLRCHTRQNRARARALIAAGKLKAPPPREVTCPDCGSAEGMRTPAGRIRARCGACTKARLSKVRAEQARARWEEWKAAGIDPSHGGEAGAKRGRSIAASNAKKPRRRQPHTEAGGS